MACPRRILLLVCVPIFLAVPSRADEIKGMLDKFRARASEVSAPAGRQVPAPSKDIPPLSGGDLRSIYTKRIFPAVKAGIEAYPAKIDKQSCNLSAGFTLSALRLLGIRGGSVREGALHVYNQVPDPAGEALFMDGTISQFFRAGTPPRDAFAKFGFVGTEAELRALIRDNIEHWDFDGVLSPLPAEVLAAARGKPTADISESDGREALKAYIDLAEFTFFAGKAADLKPKAEEQDRFHAAADPNARFTQLGHDQTKQILRGYLAFEESLLAGEQGGR